MNLLDIRKLFVEHSGRYDLVEDTESFKDNGADFFIRTGQKVLDDLVDFSQTDAVYELPLKRGSDKLIVPGVRSINQVWVSAEEGPPKKLERAFLSDHVEFFTTYKGDGVPIAYALFPVRTQDPDIANTNVSAIFIGPAPDKDYTAHVLGRFYSFKLEDDRSFNYWTMNYPHTLIQAALYSIERFYRNTQGMRDHMEAILQDIQQIDFERVENMIKSRSNMADSFNERLYRPRRHFR